MILRASGTGSDSGHTTRMQGRSGEGEKKKNLKSELIVRVGAGSEGRPGPPPPAVRHGAWKRRGPRGGFSHRGARSISTSILNPRDLPRKPRGGAALQVVARYQEPNYSYFTAANLRLLPSVPFCAKNWWLMVFRVFS